MDGRSRKLRVLESHRTLPQREALGPRLLSAWSFSFLPKVGEIRFESRLRPVGEAVMVVFNHQMRGAYHIMSFRGFTAEIDAEAGQTCWSDVTRSFVYDLYKRPAQGAAGATMDLDDETMCELALDMAHAAGNAASKPYSLPSRPLLPRTVLLFPRGKLPGYEPTAAVRAFASSHNMSCRAAYDRLREELAVPEEHRLDVDGELIDLRLTSRILPENGRPGCITPYHYFSDAMIGRDVTNPARDLFSPCYMTNPVGTALKSLGLSSLPDDHPTDELRTQLHAEMRRLIGSREVFFSDDAIDAALAERPGRIKSDLNLPTYTARGKYGVEQVASEIRSIVGSGHCHLATDEELAVASCDVSQALTFVTRAKIQVSRVVSSEMTIDGHRLSLDLSSYVMPTSINKPVAPNNQRRKWSKRNGKRATDRTTAG